MINSTQAYQQAVQQSQQLIADRPDLLGRGFVQELNTEKQELFCNVNRFHLFGEAQFEEESETHQTYLSQLALTELDTQLHLHFVVDEILNVKNQVKGEGPFLFCAFHFGGYLHVPTALKLLEYDIVTVTRELAGNDVIVIDSNDPNYENKREVFASENISGLEPDAVFRIYSAFKKGKNILFYFDFFQNEMDDKRNTEAQLGQLKLMAPTYVFEIAQRLKIPVIPIFSPREGESQVSIYFNDPIHVAQTGKAGVDECVQSLFDQFYTQLERHYCQWQELPFIHQRLTGLAHAQETKPSFFQQWKNTIRTIKKTFTSQTLVFNKDHFNFYAEEDSYYLVDILTYQSAKISAPVFALLKKIKERPLSRQTGSQLLGEHLLQDLIYQSIIKPL